MLMGTLPPPPPSSPPIFPIFHLPLFLFKTRQCITAVSFSCRSITMPSSRLSSSSSSTSFIIIAIILTITTFVIIIFFYRRRSRTIPVPLLIHNSSSSSLVHRFPYNQLLAATNSFSPLNIIGKGASATVYLGVLPTGKSVAVKLIDATTSSAQLEFHNELHILSRLTSPYVVPLLGYCVDRNNDHRLLVYDYMPNRSLQETLFDETRSSDDDLGWDQRFRILQDVARALAYLHLECDPPIIHGDVKPSNVLLDMDFRARVSDFGLSRLKEEQEEEEFGPPLFSQELSGKVEEATTPAAGTGSSRHYSYNEVDFAQALQASASSKSECMLKDHLVMVEDSVIDENNNVDGKKSEGICGEDGVSGAQHCVGEDLEEGRQWGKDWWWRQDGSGEELCSKDYVTEWIGSQIGPRADTNHGWDDEDVEKSASHRSRNSPVCNNSVQLQMAELGLAKKEMKNWAIRGSDKKMHRKLHEWWGDEHRPVEISKTRVKLRKLEKKWSKSFKKPILTLSRSVRLRRKRKFGEHDGTHYCDPDSDFSFRRGLKKNKEAHSEGSELWSGDLFSRELSSTTSMR